MKKSDQTMRTKGFTLVEMTIVVIIFGLIIAGAMSYLTTFEIKNRNASAKQKLKTIKVALEGHIEQFGSLPCPSSLTAKPGTAEFSAPTDCKDKIVGIGQCTQNGSYCIQAGRVLQKEDSQAKSPTRVRIGAVPARAINVPYELTHDAWNNRIVYAVTESMAEEKGSYYSNQGGIGIVDESGNSFITPASSAAYVLVSKGIDGAGATTLLGGTRGVPCNGENAKDGENCDYTLGAQDAVFRIGFYSAVEGSARYDDFIEYDTKRGSFQNVSTKTCKDMPVCSAENVSSVPVCKVSGGSDGLPLCTTRQDVKAGIESGDEYEHDITTWKHACDFGDGWRLPSLGELRALYDHKEQVGGFEDEYYLSRSYFNPGLIENDDRKLEVWAKKFSGGGFGGSKEKTLNISPVRADRGDRGYIRCIMR